MLSLPARLAALARLADKNDSPRYAMNGLMVGETEDGYQIIVTDGRKLCTVEGFCDKHEDNPLHEQMRVSQGLVPAEAFAKAMRPVKLDALTALSETACLIQAGDSLTTLPYLEGRFPNVHPVIQNCASFFSIKVDALYLADILTVAAKLWSPQCNDRPQVRLHFQGEDKPMLVTFADEHLKFQACLMPLT